VQVNFIAPDLDMTDLVNHLRIRWVDLIPGLGIRGGSGVEARLRLAMIHSLLTEPLLRMSELYVGQHQKSGE
jgi:hypothetical protein